MRNSGPNRLFTVNAGQTLTLTGLTLTGGNGGGTTADGSGGAILNLGRLTLHRCAVFGNRTGAGGDGGAIATTGPLKATQCTFHGNNAAGSGGAIRVASFADLSPVELTHCTVAGNSCLTGDGTDLTLSRCTLTGNTGDYGGALQCQGRTNITHCIIAGNHGTFAGGGIFNKNTTAATPLTVAHSIIAKNTATEPNGTDLFNQLAKLIYDGANSVLSGFNDRSSISAPPGTILYDQEPDLSPLGDYGGPTRTIILGWGSPAKNTAASSTASPLDQRGYPMIGVPDLGACEAGNINSYPT